MAFDIGSMVKVRGRDWVVLPDSTPDFLLLKPLGGSDAEVTGVFAGAGGEDVTSASFAAPSPTAFGTASGAKLLVNAAKLAIRSGAGPFRSLGRLGVEPRPYQLVPLLMALRQNPVRLLIADDVGVGKTVEAGLIARELLDRGEITRLAVLCPPHLAEQWVEELRVKFGIDAVAVLPGTARRLERDCNPGQSVFERYRSVVVSLDLVKSDRWRQDFLTNAPEFVIVDEAHASAEGEGLGAKRHQRYRLLEDLARDQERHLLLVTATPHSGKEDAFRSLLKLLHPDFAGLPLDLSGTQNENARITLARHLIQRGRKDIQDYLREDTPFPRRHEGELKYTLHPEYAELFDDVLAYARESVQVPGEVAGRTRIRWWAALGLLRALASSPQAAAATLRERALTADETDAAVIEGLGRELVFDPDPEEREAIDVTPGAQVDAPDSAATRKLLALAERADALAGQKDRKLTLLTVQVRDLVKAGFAPIVFCRFIATADAVAAHLAATLKNVEVASVTGRLTPAERVERINELAQAEARVLVATDCLSEGINLQQAFSAVIHYDLPWNPTRLDQREGRVDRYGQPAPEVRVLTIYGEDNRIDTLILDVLVRKHRLIRATLGTSIPAPDEAESLLDVLLSRVLNVDRKAVQPALFDPSEFPDVQAFDLKWRDAAEGERRSRSRFAQNAIRPDEVATELVAVRAALGDAETAHTFVLDALQGAGVIVTPSLDGTYRADPGQVDVRPEFRDFLKAAPTFRFGGAAERHVTALARNHPLVEQLASTVLGQALDDPERAMARRVGVIRTSGVSTVTTLLLLRHRFHLTGRRNKDRRKWQTLAEELDTLAYRGRADAADWLDAPDVTRLLDLPPEGNLDPVQKEERLIRALTELEDMQDALLERARKRAEALLTAHERVRGAARGVSSGVAYSVEPPGPPDLLGVYVFVPAPRPGGSA
ncbi:ATP-dependent helicase [Deinococcus radiopugnans]|uniref:ATP-dependent helicase n=1 Tax=Deinococcus radiopugnans TaxID=57497 RepID=A0A0A7KG44_9DEIO|nr:helicase-related protein [Deinococcus radiopugnans]AIZ45147.1 ATP-dependent helicase [Deinococcus radiopugnans]